MGKFHLKPQLGRRLVIQSLSLNMVSSGTVCAARGCHYNSTKLNNWRKEECLIHKPRTKAECPCEQWYDFHRIPKDKDAKKMWLRNLNLKRIPKVVHVCSFHFVDKKPTRENPYPTLHLGPPVLERQLGPPEKRRRICGLNPGKIKCTVK